MKDRDKDLINFSTSNYTRQCWDRTFCLDSPSKHSG